MKGIFLPPFEISWGRQGLGGGGKTEDYSRFFEKKIFFGGGAIAIFAPVYATHLMDCNSSKEGKLCQVNC